MGYLADLDRARAHYRELMVVDRLTHYEHAIQLLVGHGSKRRDEAIEGLTPGPHARIMAEPHGGYVRRA
jgi:hypothetical protein